MSQHAHVQYEMSQHDALLVRTLQALQNVPPDGPELAAAIVQEELDFSQLQRLTLDDLREARARPMRARRRGPPPPPSSLARGAAARGPLVESRRPLAFASHRVTERPVESRALTRERRRMHHHLEPSSVSPRPREVCRARTLRR